MSERNSPVLAALLERVRQPPVETMGLEQSRAEVLALRDFIQTLYGVWQEAEDDVEAAARDSAAAMQRECLKLAREWTMTWSTGDTLALLEGLEGIPLPSAYANESEEETA